MLTLLQNKVHFQDNALLKLRSTCRGDILLSKTMTRGNIATLAVFSPPVFCMFSVFVQGAEVLQSAKLYGSLKAALTGTGWKCMEVA